MALKVQHLSRSRLRNLALAVLILGSSAAHASEFCDALTRLTVETAEVQPLPEAQSCRKTLSFGGSSAYHCAWEFPYRSALATETFERFNQQIKACFENGTEAIVDPGVNHPDSYRQHEHHIGGDTISVSIKDKAAQQKTYIFVTVTYPAKE